MTEQAALLATLLMPSHPQRRVGEARVAYRTVPFFRIRGVIQNEPALAMWARGHLTAHAALRPAAERLAQSTVGEEDGLDLQARLRLRIDCIRALLQCFDKIDHVEVGVDVETSHTRAERNHDMRESSCPQRADACPVCRSKATSFEYHAANWCPSGSRTAHIHRRCSGCGHIWYEAP